MIRIPPTKPNTWHERREWVNYANSLFRYFSRRGNYALQLIAREGILAAVSMETRVVILNPEFPASPPRFARQHRHKPADFRQSILSNMRGYLAHEAAHVRYSSDKPAGHLGQVWNAIEDERIERIMSEQHPMLEADFTSLGDTHLLRAYEKGFSGHTQEGILLWRWAHDHPQINWEPANPEEWERVKPHVEAAWVEENPDMVEVHAQRILDELGLPEGGEIHEILVGPLVTSPEPEEGDAEGSLTVPADGEDENPEENPGDGDQDQDEDDTDSEDEDSPDDSDDDAEDDDESDTGNPDKPEDHDEDDADDKPAATDGEDESDANKENSDEDALDADDVSMPDEPDVIPEEPDHVEARRLLEEVEGHARSLAAALSTDNRPHMRVAHQSRGRFSYDRFVAQSQRVFRHKEQPNREKLPRITLLHDISSSMGPANNPHYNQYQSVRATMMLHRACELTSTPFNLIVFNEHHKNIVLEDTNPEVAAATIGGIRSTGGTRLEGALRAALEQPSRDTQRKHLIIIYCDGQIMDSDARAVRQLAKSHPDTFILPILIGNHVDPEQFNTAFGRTLHVADTNELAPKIKAWMTANKR